MESGRSFESRSTRSSTSAPRGGDRFSPTVLAAAIGALLILTVTAVTSRISVHFHQQRETRLIQRLGDVYLDGLSAVVAPHLGSEDRKALDAALERVATYHDGVREVRLVVRAPDGEILGNLARDARSASVAPPPIDAAVSLATDDDSARVWVQRPLREGGRIRAILSAQLDLQPIREARLKASLESLGANAFLAIVLAGFGWVVMGRLLHPLKLLTEALAKAAEGSPRPVARGNQVWNAHVRTLLDEYDRMVAALAERRQLQTALAERLRAADLGRLAATIAHEVRNPLAGMLNAVDTARRFRDDPKAVTDSIDLLDRGLRAIERVVDTSLSMHRPPKDREHTAQIDFDDLARLLAAAALRQHVTLDWNATISASWPIDGTIVRQIVLNLTLNAIGATGTGGRVGFAVEEAPEHVAIVVSDGGPGLGPDLADRLRRLDLEWIDTSEGGIGLGVVIRAVVSLRGRIEVRDGAEGGTAIVVRLPRRGRDDGGSRTAEEAR